MFKLLSTFQVQGRWIRNFSQSTVCMGVDKGLLAKLRKNTGFSLINCKRALELHENDLSKAETWLQSEAQKQGWDKVAKLSGRAATQGLVGVHIEGNSGIMVEVNCETDFVARNEKFQNLVATIAKECLIAIPPPLSMGGIAKENLSSEQLQSVTTREGKSLADILAMAVGNVGEKMSIARGIRFTSPPGIDLIGYTHPKDKNNIELIGKFGTLLAVKNPSQLTDIARELCLQIIGLNPKEIGSFEMIKTLSIEEDTSTNKSIDVSSTDNIEDLMQKVEEDMLKESETVTEEKEESSALLLQEFLTYPGRKVGEVLLENDIEVVDFVRFECGENISEQN